MLDFIAGRGSLLMLAATVAWATMAFAFGLTADAPWRSVMWPLFERLFESLAVSSGVAWLAVLAWRCWPRRRAPKPLHLAT